MGKNKRPLIYSEKWTFRLTPDQLQTLKELRNEYKIPSEFIDVEETKKEDGKTHYKMTLYWLRG